MEKVLEDFKRVCQYFGDFSNIDKDILQTMKNLAFKLKTQQEILVGRSAVKVNPAVSEIWEQWKLHCIEEGFTYNIYNERASYELYMSWAGGSVGDFTKLIQTAMSRGYTSIQERLAAEIFHSPEVNRAVTFMQSQYADLLFFSISMLAEPFVVENNVMEVHYFERAMLYSKQKGYTSLDWKATVMSWMKKDLATITDKKTGENKLVKLSPELLNGHCIGVGEQLKKVIAESLKRDAAYVEKLNQVKARFEKNVLTFFIPDASYYDALEERSHDIQQVLFRYSKDIKLEYAWNVVNEPALPKNRTLTLGEAIQEAKPHFSNLPKKTPKLPEKKISDLGKSLDEKFAHLMEEPDE